MAVEKFAVSIDDWVVKECVGETVNRSSRIQELIIKGWMAERLKTQDKLNPNASANSLYTFPLDLNLADAAATA